MILLAAVCIVIFSNNALAVDVKDTRMLSRPAVSKTHIAFIYAGDLWVADVSGKNVRRLTTASPESVGNLFIPDSSRPAFSPDGTLIAFSGQRDGNTDVYVIPTGGGTPKRLTWHPESDHVQGFTPDGSSILFTSSRNAIIGFVRGEYTQLYKVPLNGGFPEAVPIPSAYRAAYSPDGTMLAYNPLPEFFHQWKHYRGGAASEIWVYIISDRSVRKIPQPEGRCNDVNPMWMGDKIYFRSDRNGEFNLFSFDTRTREIRQLTRHEDFPVVNASAGDGKIIYEQAGYLHIYDPQKAQGTRLIIGVTADLPEVRAQYVKGAGHTRNADISPTGARAVFEMRGEIITVPAEKGDPRNLTNTPGVHERSPVWSPDGRYIAYFSDESGEYELHVRLQDGKGEVRRYKMTGAGFYDRPVWSPDGGKISYTDNSWSLYVLDLKESTSKKISSEYRYGLIKSLNSAWSPDSKWVAYTLNTKANIQKVFVYSVEKDRSYPLTDGMSEASSPVFDKSGKYLYLLSSTNAGPLKQWLDQSNADLRTKSSIHLGVLARGVPSPLAKENDEEKGREKRLEAGKKGDVSPAETMIDFDGLDQRILTLPLTSGNYRSLQAGRAGEIYYLRDDMDGGDGKATLCRFDLKSRKEESILTDVASYILSADKKKILYQSKDIWGIISASPNMKIGQGKIDTERVDIRIDPLAEWHQIFHEAWRINRDYFYDPNMHGVDWNAMRRKYAEFLPHLAHRSDLYRVMQWMGSELAVGHHGVASAPPIQRTETVPGGLLGADYIIENGRYRFKKVYGGLNWTPGLKSLLTEPGVDVKPGEYLLSVAGEELTSKTNIYSLFENTAGKIVEITVGSRADGSGARTVSVVPIADEAALRNRDWIEGNLKRVTEATGGRVAYVFVPDTQKEGYEYFKRYFFPQVHREGIIIDGRFNKGGAFANTYIETLRRQFVCQFAMRYGEDIRTPQGYIPGPKVVIINEMAGSGGDLFPWTFRKFGMGKLVGKRTWGGLVGNLPFPPLMDGAVFTAPNTGAWDESGWIAENVGIPPDIEVEQWPAEVAAGRDPQLEKAIEVVMEELRKNPPKKLNRPPYPVKK